VVLRLVRLQPSTYDVSSVYDVTMVNIFTQAVLHFAIIAECLTCLRPLMQTFHEELQLETRDYWGRYI